MRATYLLHLTNRADLKAAIVASSGTAACSCDKAKFVPIRTDCFDTEGLRAA